MIRSFRQLLNNFFMSRSALAFLDALNERPSAVEAIVFEEVGLPNGKVTVDRWWRSNSASYYEHSENGREVDNERVERPINAFLDLLNEINKLDKPPIKNYSAPVRDGVVYFISWGSVRQFRELIFRNPKADSIQGELVRLLRSNRW